MVLRQSERVSAAYLIGNVAVPSVSRIRGRNLGPDSMIRAPIADAATGNYRPAKPFSACISNPGVGR